jgi:hypothetical protein
VRLNPILGLADNGECEYPNLDVVVLELLEFPAPLTTPFGMVTLNEYLLCPLMDDRSSSCYC